MKTFSIFCCALFCCFFLNESLSAAENFSVGTQIHQTAEDGVVTNYFLISETNVFFFMPPLDWKLSASATERKVTFSSPDLINPFSVIMKVTSENPALEPEVKTEQLRQQVRERYPDAEITSESVAYTAGKPGRTFDLKGPTVNNLLFFTRVTFVPFVGGSLEISMTALPDNFHAHEGDFSDLVGTFRVEPVQRK